MVHAVSFDIKTNKHTHTLFYSFLPDITVLSVEARFQKLMITVIINEIRQYIPKFEKFSLLYSNV